MPHLLVLRLLFAIVSFPAVGMLFGSLAPAASVELWHVGSSEDFVCPPERPTRGALLMMGGGGDVDAAWHWFASCAGGGDLVVLRTSGEDGYQDYLYKEIGGFSSVTTIKFRDGSGSQDPSVLARLLKAEAIFLAGGDQATYIRWWKDTPVAAALNAHIKAGKPLGGTSAGLAVLGQFYFSALHDTVTSEETLRNPFGEKVTLGDGFLSASLLSGIITDSHFSSRQRLGRLVTFLACLKASHPAVPRLAGLGIDEATALCVEPDGTARVVTTKAGAVWLVTLDSVAAMTPGQALEATVSVVCIKNSDTFDLCKLQVSPPRLANAVRVTGGQLEFLTPGSF